MILFLSTSDVKPLNSWLCGAQDIGMSNYILEVFMKLKELLKYIVDDVCIYVRIDKDGQYKNLYQGKTQNIPSELLERNIRLIGVRKKDCLDIEIHNFHQQPR